MIMGNNGINDYKKCRQIMKPQMHSIEQCALRHIAPAAAMVDDFEWNPKTLTKHNFYLAFLR